MDLIFDWDEQRVSIYIDKEPISSDTFFTQRKLKLESGNALSLYGLSPDGISLFRNLRVCDPLCTPEEELEFSDLSGALLGYGSAFSMVTGLSALLLSILV